MPSPAPTAPRASSPTPESHQRTFFRQSGWMMIAAVGSGAFMFAVHLLSPRLLPSEYGDLTTLLQVMAWLTIPAIGLQTVFAQQASAALTEREQRQLTGTVRAVAQGSFLLWLALTVVAWFWQDRIVDGLKLTNATGLWIALLTGLALLWQPITLGLLQGRQNFLWLGWASILNGLGRFAVSAVLVVFASAAFSSGDLRDVGAFATRLKQAPDPVSAYLAGRLSEPTKRRLSESPPAGADSTELKKVLLKDLNVDLATNRLFYDAKRFSGVELRPETKKLIAQDLSEHDILRLNRLLMEDAFPAEMGRRLLLTYGFAAVIMFAALVGLVVSFAIGAWHSRAAWLGARGPIVWRDWLARVVPLTLGLGTVQYMASADMIAVRRYFARELTDSYGAAGTLCRALVVFTAPIASVMFPKIVQSVARKEKSNLLLLTLATTLALGGIAALGLTISSPLLFKYVFKQQSYALIGPLIKWFAWAMVPLATANVLISNLLARGRYAATPWFALVAVGYAIALNYFHDSFLMVVQTLGVFNLLLLGVAVFFTWRGGPPVPVEAVKR